MDQVDWNLIARHFFGECTEEEAARVQAWMEAEPERRRFLSELREVLSATTEQRDSARDVDALWGRLEQHIDQQEREAAEADRRASGSIEQAFSRSSSEKATIREAMRHRRSDRPSRRRLRRSAARRVMRVAIPVVLVICVALAVLWSRGGGSLDSAESGAKVFATERGQRATVRLTDGTLVRLNAASSITVSPSFGVEQRSVRLEGEAYFDVVRDTNRPFIVRAGGATTRVLGTVFDVSAYPDDNQVRVVVAEGKVAFEAESSAEKEAADGGRGVGGGARAEAPSQGVVLTAREMATHEVASGPIVRSRADPDRYLAWMEGDLFFEDAAFREVVRSVERWYDIDVVIDKTAMPSGHLKARFSEREPLGEVLHVIAAAFDLRYEREADTVQFYSSTTAPVR